MSDVAKAAAVRGDLPARPTNLMAPRYTVRENLVDILERELLGPIHGPMKCCRSARARSTLLG